MENQENQVKKAFPIAGVPRNTWYHLELLMGTFPVVPSNLGVSIEACAWTPRTTRGGRNCSRQPPVPTRRRHHLAGGLPHANASNPSYTCRAPSTYPIDNRFLAIKGSDLCGGLGDLRRCSTKANIVPESLLFVRSSAISAQSELTQERIECSGGHTRDMPGRRRESFNGGVGRRVDQG